MFYLCIYDLCIERSVFINNTNENNVWIELFIGFESHFWGLGERD